MCAREAAVGGSLVNPPSIMGVHSTMHARSTASEYRALHGLCSRQQSTKAPRSPPRGRATYTMMPSPSGTRLQDLETSARTLPATRHTTQQVHHITHITHITHSHIYKQSCRVTADTSRDNAKSKKERKKKEEKKKTPVCPLGRHTWRRGRLAAATIASFLPDLMMMKATPISGSAEWTPREEQSSALRH